MKELSKFQKAKIVVGIINDLNSLESKSYLTIEPEYDDDSVMEKIAERTDIQFRDICETGIVPINEYIRLTFDEREDRLLRRLNSLNRPQFSGPRHMPEFNFPEELTVEIKKFEEKNIPSTGPCNTRVGEIFRAIQRIQYRAYNDGDFPWIIGSPSFMSYMFLISEIDRLNYSSESYDDDRGEYHFDFEDDFLNKMAWNGKIYVEVEDPLCNGLDITKHQLMQLIQLGKIKDSTNEWDSRDYTLLRSKGW
jgi:hypothetical protein